jgi:NADH:ubiquinone oxidoreductase subunit E
MQVRAELEKVLGIKAGETTPDGEYTLQTVACMGACALAPAVMIDGEVNAKMTPKKIREILGNGTKE